MERTCGGVCERREGWKVSQDSPVFRIGGVVSAQANERAVGKKLEMRPLAFRGFFLLTGTKKV